MRHVGRDPRRLGALKAAIGVGNPSGTTAGKEYIGAHGVRKLAAWAKAKGYPLTAEGIQKFKTERGLTHGAAIGPTTADAFYEAAAGTNQQILADAVAYRGTSTRAGPSHGKLACAWAINSVLRRATGKTIGTNTNYVPSMETALKGGKGHRVATKDALPGDIVIAPNAGHIGIYLGNERVLSNSSSSASFSWESSLNFDGAYGRGGSRIYRVKP